MCTETAGQLLCVHHWLPTCLDNLGWSSVRRRAVRSRGGRCHSALVVTFVLGVEQPWDFHHAFVVAGRSSGRRSSGCVCVIAIASSIASVVVALCTIGSRVWKNRGLSGADASVTTVRRWSRLWGTPVYWVPWCPGSLCGRTTIVGQIRSVVVERSSRLAHTHFQDPGKCIPRVRILAFAHHRLVMPAQVEERDVELWFGSACGPLGLWDDAIVCKQDGPDVEYDLNGCNVRAVGPHSVETRVPAHFGDGIPCDVEEPPSFGVGVARVIETEGAADDRTMDASHRLQHGLAKPLRDIGARNLVQTPLLVEFVQVSEREPIGGDLTQFRAPVLKRFRGVRTGTGDSAHQVTHCRGVVDGGGMGLVVLSDG